MQLESRIQLIIVDTLTLPVDAATLTSQTKLFGQGEDSLDLDSLSSLEILAVLSDTYGLPLEDVEPKDFATVGSLATYLRANGVPDDDGSR